ncbi:hypothetical protein CQA66_00170 [Helicobacter aurati]|uniref:Transmembrane protein n=1 Tax=Helicobacter aurati TaxID=137778 RepID=A0A3D8J823_9HELI|nr:hypothetical protein [Helicobacter aurati]RDU73647.1 hypothetical protein CQA66_00170 [Helicobacter aurati]
MNKLARIIIIVGAVIIVSLLIMIPILSKMVTKSIQEHLNNGMEQIRSHISESDDNFGIQQIEYSPFECSGISDYECRSQFITLYTNDETAHDSEHHGYVKFSDISLKSRDVSDKNTFSFNVSTSISYPSIDTFFGDSNSNSVIAFLNHSADALLPNTLRCQQNYSHHTLDTQDSKIVTANNACQLESEIFNTKIEIKNLFSPNIDKPHILGVIYAIVMAINGDTSNPQLQPQNIPHELDSIAITLESKKTFKDFLKSNTKFTDQQKEVLQQQFDGNITFVYLSAPIFLSKFFGNQGKEIAKAFGDIMQGKKKKLSLSFILKDAPKFQPLQTFQNMDTLQWLRYLGENYVITLNTED